jgi:hypothetical protein
MQKVDMSAKAVTTRLRRVSQLRKLTLSLQKAKLVNDENQDKPEKSSKGSGRKAARKR